MTATRRLYDELELTRRRAARDEEHRLALERGALRASPCHCDNPAFDTDIDGTRTCLYCGRAEVVWAA